LRSKREHGTPRADEYVFEYIESSRPRNVLTTPLTVREVEAARPRPKPYGVADGDGLVLRVTPEGNKFWRFRYRLHGKQPRISLGCFPDVTLQKARQQAAAYRTLVCRTNGIDPYCHYLVSLFIKLPLDSSADDYAALMPWAMPAVLISEGRGQ